MALESLSADDLAGTGDAEALCGALMGLHLRHNRSPFLLTRWIRRCFWRLYRLLFSPLPEAER